VGLKASRGRVAGSGAGWLALATEGPLARTVADAALFLDAMGGPHATDSWRLPVSSPDAFQAAARRAPGRALRVGRLVESGYDLSPECLAAVDKTAALLTELGHVVEDVPSGSLPTTAEVRPAVLSVLASSIGLIVESAVAPEQRHLLMPYTRWLAEQPVTGVELARGQAVLTGAAIRLVELMSRYDVVLSPTTTAPPLPTSELRADDAAGSLEAMARWSAFTPPANIAGTPAISLPVHMTADGLPIGVQLSATSGADELLISLAAQLEEAVGWPAVHPPAWHQ
jgi:amidase